MRRKLNEELNKQSSTSVASTRRVYKDDTSPDTRRPAALNRRFRRSISSATIQRRDIYIVRRSLFRSSTELMALAVNTTRRAGTCRITAVCLGVDLQSRKLNDYGQTIDWKSAQLSKLDRGESKHLSLSLLDSPVSFAALARAILALACAPLSTQHMAKLKSACEAKKTSIFRAKRNLFA